MIALLDACVLLPMPLADTLLRLAENPSLYQPLWSAEIMAEVSRNLIRQWNISPDMAAHREEQLREHFPDSWVEGYEVLIPSMPNDPKDRHVLAAAVASGASVLVTLNTKDFPEEMLRARCIELESPSGFLLRLYRLDRDTVGARLRRQAVENGTSLERQLKRLSVNAPKFVAHFCKEENITLD